MYDLYPDWGPARHREPVETLDAPATRGTTATLTRDPHLQMVQDALDPRDGEFQRPDDN